MITIVLLESLHEDAVKLLREVGEVVRAETPSVEAAMDLAPNADAILTRGRGRITEGVLRLGRHLKCVARAGSGLDNVDVEAATARGIPVIYAPDAVTETTAEHAIALMLAAARNLVTWTAKVKSGKWSERATSPMTLDLSGRTLGVIGLGRIGRRVAEMASALGMKVVYCSRTRTDERFTRVGFDELLASSDVITLHTDLNPSTQILINEHAFAKMKPGVVLVNTARGTVVDEDALIEALKSGHLRAYAADVMAQEPPPPNHPLFYFRNVVLTPHSAALTEGAYRRMCVETAENVSRVLCGEKPDPAHVKNPEVFDR